jgi:lycopene cyclase domain-containing protein
MKGLYLLVLIISLSGLTFIDYRRKLAFFFKPKQTLRILLLPMALFILWDIAGIAGHIFFIGQNKYLLGLRIGQFPMEELFFLALLNYTSLLIYLVLKQRTAAS